MAVILAQTGSALRGLPRASLVLIDEASLASDEMYQALRSMPAMERGSIWLMSTPWPTRGSFMRPERVEAASGKYFGGELGQGQERYFAEPCPYELCSARRTMAGSRAMTVR